MRYPLAKMDRAVAARRRFWSGQAVRWGGGLIAVGSVLPWAWVPLAGLKLPLPGILGFGALTLLLGAWLFRRPAWPGAGMAAIATLGVAWAARAALPPAINRLFLGLEMRLQPMNDLLARFGIAPFDLFDTGTPWRELRGPGTLLVMVGALLALAGTALAATTARGVIAMGRCTACGHRDRSARILAFCVRCGAPMPAERACPDCHTLAEPGDLCCGLCGARLA